MVTTRSIRLIRLLAALSVAAAALLSPLCSSAAFAAPATGELVSKFEVKASKYYNGAGFSSNRYAYTEAEVRMLAVVIHMEARGEPYKCKLAVGNVVMNRVLSPGYPGKTIKEVVTRPHQFCYKSGVKPSAECLRAARDVLEREIWVVPQNTYFFKSCRSRSNWGSHTFHARIGNTAFYRDSRYKGRYNGSTVPQALYERVYRWPQYGCKPGARVRKIQTMLDALGYDAAVDGHFGPETRSALIRFQKNRRLAADGVAGPATLRALIMKYGVSRYLKL
jgi:hypothetical protein